MSYSSFLKMAIVIVVVFGLLVAGFSLWEPIQIKWFELKLRSNDLAERVRAVDALIGLGDAGKTRFKEVFADGQEAAEILIECWEDVDQLIGDKERAEKLLVIGDEWKVSGYYNPLSYIHIAAYRGFVESVSLLLGKGASINVQCEIRLKKERADGSGGSDYQFIRGTPMHVAAGRGMVIMLERLLLHDLDVNVKDDLNPGWTPLHSAAANGQIAAVGWLLSKGADVNAKNWHNKTALDVAIFEGNKDMEALLREHGGKTGAEVLGEDASE